MFSYKRPESIPYPNIWHRFKARDCDSDEIVNYCIQDVPYNRFDDAIEQMVDIVIVMRNQQMLQKV